MDPDPTSFFSDFKDAKRIFFHIFFLSPSPVLKIKVFAKNFILQALFQSVQNLYEKRE
jgi:hypothetical protein